MNLPDILQLKYLRIDFTRDIQLQDDGQGVYIKEWNLPDPKPTSEQVAQWAIELQPQFDAEQNVMRIKELNKDVMAQLLEIDMKSIRALRENAVTRIQELETQAIVLRGKLRV